MLKKKNKSITPCLITVIQKPDLSTELVSPDKKEIIVALVKKWIDNYTSKMADVAEQISNLKERLKEPDMTPEERAKKEKEDQLKREKWTLAYLERVENNWKNLQESIKNFKTKYGGLQERLFTIRKKFKELQQVYNFSTQAPLGDFKKIGENLYYIENEKPLNWSQSMNHCNSLNSSLIDFENEKEWTNIAAHLQPNNSYWSAKVNISDTSEDRDAFYKSQLLGPSQNLTSFNDSDCFLLHAHFNHTLNAGKCASENFYICEANKITEPISDN